MRKTLAVALALCVPWMAVAVERQTLAGHRSEAVARLRPTDRLAATNRLHLAIGLPWRNREALTNLLRQVSDPASPGFRRYLSAEEFAARFGPSEEDYEAVKAFALASGLRIKAVHPNRVMLDVEGEVSAIERAFHVGMRTYSHPTEARLFYAPDTEPSCDLSPRLLHIAGLSDYRLPQARLRREPADAASVGVARGGSGTRGSFLGTDFRNAYAPGVTLDGTGQSVGVFALDGYFASDIAAYVKLAGIPNVPLRNVLIDGFNGTPTSSASGSANEETALDIEMIVSMAPGLSQVYVYEGSPNGSGAVINHILNRMATDNLAKQLSCSWGFDIDILTHQIFQQYVAQGQSFFLASGDDGAFADVVVQPSDNPYITVVGGTVLTTTAAKAWDKETVWSGSGGGISSLCPIPSYQQGVAMSVSGGSSTMRNTPDVAMVASNVWVTADRGQSFAASGTSVAAPLWAAFTALVNQQAEAKGQPPVGFLNPALYRIGRSAVYTNAFHDITVGNNKNPGSPSRFSAVPGYDLCTGWGTPRGSNLIQALIELPPPSLLISPAVGFSASGKVRGPFNVTARDYTLTNTGGTALEWSLIQTAAWLTASPTEGRLEPGGPATTVRVTLNSAATNLLVGDYSATIWLTNRTQGNAQDLLFDLAAGNGGFETGDFAHWTLSGSSQVNYAYSLDYSVFAGDTPIPGVADAAFVQSGYCGAFLGQASRLGTLSQNLPTEAGQRYRLSFWLSSPAGGDPSQFRAAWGGTALLDLVNAAAFSWTNYQFTVTATGATTALRFSFRNDANAFALDGVRVERLSDTARIAGAAFVEGVFQLTLESSAGAKYTLEHTRSLTEPAWETGQSATGTGGLLLLTDGSGPTAARYFRVRVE